VIATLLAQSSSSGDAAAAGVSIVFSIILLVIGIALFAFHIYVLVDLLKYSDGTWQATGQNKTLWIVLWVLTLCCGFALILDLIYWFAIRPKLQAAGAGPGGPGAYPNYPS
jgi:H+/Cl- antiporter ClcA